MIDPMLAAVIASPVALSIVIGLFKNSLARNIKAMDDSITQALGIATKAQQSAQETSLKLAVHSERVDVQISSINQDIGEIKGMVGKGSERVDRLAEHWQIRFKEIDTK